LDNAAYGMIVLVKEKKTCVSWMEKCSNSLIVRYVAIMELSRPACP
jgi:hypothetical protein